MEKVNDLDIAISSRGVGPVHGQFSPPDVIAGDTRAHMAGRLHLLPMGNATPQPSRLGRYILDRMAALGMTRQTDLAEASGLSQAAISRLIFNQTQPRVDTLNLAARGLQVPPAELMAYAYDFGPAPDVRPLNVRAVEVDAVLSPDSGLSDAERAHLDTVLAALLAPHLAKLRRQRSA